MAGDTNELPPLNRRQARFVAEYLVDLNATQAAIRAGYSAKTARVIGPENLSKPAISAAIRREQEKQLEDICMSALEVKAELSLIARFRLGKYLHVTKDGDPFIDLSLMDEEGRAALSETTVEDFTDGRGDDARDVRRVKIKAHDKLGALNTLAKHHKLTTDRIEVDVTDDFAELMMRAERRLTGG